jgi:hypothetical protein
MTMTYDQIERVSKYFTYCTGRTYAGSHLLKVESREAVAMVGSKDCSRLH